MAGPWVGGRVAGPWVGCWSRAAPGPAATSAALPCRRGCRGRGISHRSSSEVKSRIPKPAARRRAKYPRRPRRGTSKRARRRARPRQARPSRVAEGVGDARFHVGTVPPGRYAARRRAKYPRRPRHGTSKRARHRARHRARPRQARPSRVAEGVGDARFHVGTVPPGRYAARRRAKYPRRPRHGTSKRARHRARHRARPRQARPSRVAEGVGDAGFHVRSEIPHPQTSGGRAATLRSTRFDRRGDDAFQITILAMNKILLRTEISRRAPHVRGGVAVHFPVRRVVPDGGAPVCTDALNCVPPVATI